MILLLNSHTRTRQIDAVISSVKSCLKKPIRECIRLCFGSPDISAIRYLIDVAIKMMKIGKVEASFH
jgi:hypothetical protein